jgi:hypothetical protein
MGRAETARPLDAMRRAAVAALGLAAAAAAGVLLLGRSGAERSAPVSRPLTVRALFSQPAAEFGDRLTAQVVVLLDRTRVRPGSLHVDYGLAPLTELAAARTTRTRRGRLTVVSVSVPVACLGDACVVATGPTPISLPPVTVLATTNRGGTLHGTARWPRLDVASRVSAADLAAAKPPFRSDALAPPATYRIAPGTLAVLLDVLAGLLAAAGVGLVTWNGFALARRLRPAPPEDEFELALRQTRAAAALPARERRRAVGRLSRLLVGRDRRLAGVASELAWSERTPEPDALSALSAEVEQEVDR